MFDMLRLNRGNEEVVYHEDVVGFPALLDHIPGWRNYFTEALSIFEKSGFTGEARSLGNLLDRIDRTRRQPWRSIRPFDGHQLVTVEGADNIVRLIACPIGKDDDAQVNTVNGVPRFKSGKLEFGLAAKITFTGGAPGGGTFGIRLIFPDELTEETCYCHSVLYETQPFLLGSWREYRANDRRIVDMVVHSTTLAGTDTILLVTFMNARPNIWNALPIAFEIWRSA